MFTAEETGARRRRNVLKGSRRDSVRTERSRPGGGPWKGFKILNGSPWSWGPGAVTKKIMGK